MEADARARGISRSAYNDGERSQDGAKLQPGDGGVAVQWLEDVLPGSDGMGGG